jgi:hypothetical protein
MTRKRTGGLGDWWLKGKNEPYEGTAYQLWQWFTMVEFEGKPFGQDPDEMIHQHLRKYSHPSQHAYTIRHNHKRFVFPTAKYAKALLKCKTVFVHWLGSDDGRYIFVSEKTYREMQADPKGFLTSPNAKPIDQTRWIEYQTFCKTRK